MRIVFLAVDDEFAGRMQAHLYKRHPGLVVGSVISTCAIYKKSPLAATLLILNRSGFRYGFEMFKMKVVRALTDRSAQLRPSQLARRHGVELFYSKNINEESSLRQLEEWAPDLVISTNFSHYIGRRARRMPRIMTWNLHKSHLPDYRGIAPSFYALLEGATEVGATLHEVDDGFDTGAIIRQVRVTVTPSDTIYSLNQKTSDAGGRMLADLLGGENLRAIAPIPQPAGPWPAHTYPTRAQIRAFLAKGNSF
jgi:folate-dependent phosphoribosylglycinamide formyltransferase PurN